MEPTDLTIRVLQEIRDEVRGLRAETNQRFDGLHAEFKVTRDQADARFEVIEATLKELAEQMVMVGRALRTLLEVRPTSEHRLSDLERRVDLLEKATH